MFVGDKLKWLIIKCHYAGNIYTQFERGGQSILFLKRNY
jgi:hypothetical protein